MTLGVAMLSGGAGGLVAQPEVAEVPELPGAGGVSSDQPSDGAQGAVDQAPPVVADRATTEAAMRLLNTAVTVQADGTHNGLLRALRHLQDPALGPLFLGLSQAQHPSLRVHGILGLAEINQPRGLTVGAIAQVDRPDVQAELISAALDGDLISEDTRRTLLGWAGLDAGVKLLLATPAVAAGEFDAATPGYADLVAALDHEALGRRGLAALVLHQLGDGRGTRVLEALVSSDTAEADPVRAMLLETAWTHGLSAAAGWAYDIALRPALPARLEMLALKVAIRFGDERADARWSELYEQTDDAAVQTRLALLGLDAAPWLSPERFDPVMASADPLVAQLGHTARGVSLRRMGLADHAVAEASVVKLIQLGHPQACRWAADYAKETGSAELAAAVVVQTLPGEPRGRAHRLDAVVRATQTLIQLDPARCEAQLPAALTIESADATWQRAVLLGLIRSRSDVAARICAKLPPWSDRDTAALALTLRMQRPDVLTQQETADLEHVIRGGVEIDDSLRVQIAWGYLQRTGQGDQAIAALLASP